MLELSNRIDSLWRHNGDDFTVTYLKEAHRLFVKAISGQPESCKTCPRLATRRGLPLIIPGSLRLRIEAGELDVIKLVLTLLSVFRVMRAKSKLKLETITAPFKGVATILPD